MYVVVVPEDLSKSKVLPSFLIEPLIRDTDIRKGKFTEVRTGNMKLLVKPHKTR